MTWFWGVRGRTEETSSVMNKLLKVVQLLHYSDLNRKFFFLQVVSWYANDTFILRHKYKQLGTNTFPSQKLLSSLTLETPSMSTIPFNYWNHMLNEWLWMNRYYRNNNISANSLCFRKHSGNVIFLKTCFVRRVFKHKYIISFWLHILASPTFT